MLETGQKSRGARATAALWLALLCVAIFYMALLFDYKFQLGDEGVAIVDAWRIYLGEAPHRDFFEVIPPASFLPTALAFKLLGVSLRSTRVVTLLYGVLLIAGADVVLRRLTSDGRARLVPVALLIPFGVFYWPMPSHHWLVDVLQIFACAALLEAEAGKKPLVWGALAGGLTGIAGFTLQDQGGYFAALLLIAFFPWIADRALRRRLLLSWVFGLALVAALFGIYIFGSGGLSLKEFLDQIITFPMSRYSTAPGNAGSLLSGWEVFTDHEFYLAWLERPVHLSSLFVLAALLAALPVSSVLLVGAAFVGRWQRPARVGLLFALVVAHLAACLHRWSFTNVVWAAPPLFVMLAWSLARAAQHSWRPLRTSAIATGGCLIALSLAAGAGNVMRSAPIGTTSFQTPGGSLRSTAERAVKTAQETVDAIEKYVPQGAPLFCGGYIPLYNFLSQRPNPTRYTIFMYPSYNTAPQASELMASLDAHPDAHVLVTIPMKGTDLVFYLEDKYRVEWKNDATALLVRKSR